MAGYGSPPPMDQANNPNRQVGRDSGVGGMDPSALPPTPAAPAAPAAGGGFNEPGGS